MRSIREQIHRNAVALISLVIAVGSLGYNTWRNETTEAQRNVRHAAFRVLESLGELQEIADYRYYYLTNEGDPAREGQLRVRGFGSAAMIRDLSMVMPEPAPAAGIAVHELWVEHVNFLSELDVSGRHTERARRAEREISRGVSEARAAMLEVLKRLE
ncbi:MAG: hypothetical protein HKN58_02855 [Xanthomonadales bacterium]|nr:hypothetical protein [Xanthomonadales bacterium]